MKNPFIDALTIELCQQNLSFDNLAQKLGVSRGKLVDDLFSEDLTINQMIKYAAAIGMKLNFILEKE